MKTRSLINGLIVALIVLILYAIAGHDFVKFYFGGKSEMVAEAHSLNALCNAQGACPVVLDSWHAGGTRGGALFKGNLAYFVISGEGPAGGGQSTERQGFRLVYRFFMPDSWYEVQGGVGRQITSGWRSRGDTGLPAT